MHLEFALLFRSSTPLDSDVLRHRNQAARDWALALRRDGTLHYATPLEDVGVVVSANGESAVNQDNPPVLSVLVIRAASLDAAVALAKTHPGLAFGTQIELRPVKPVGGTALPPGE